MVDLAEITGELDAANPEVSKRAAREAVRQSLLDPCFFLRFFLPETFTLPIPAFHKGIIALALKRTDFLRDPEENLWLWRNFVVKRDSVTEAEHAFELLPDGKLKLQPSRFTLILVPRGFAKTTVAGIALSLYKVCLRLTRFSIYASESSTHAETQLSTIKSELTGNPRIGAVFGEMKPALRDEEKWAHDFFTTTTGVTMMARGRGSQIRGSLVGNRRPDQIIFDDLEDAEEVESEAQREKLRAWFYGDLIPALPGLNPEATIVGLATLLHPEALPITLKRDRKWAVVHLGAHTADEGLLWPEMMDEARYESTKESFALAGQLGRFYLEYENTVRVDGLSGFRQQDIIYEPPPPTEEFAGLAIYADPAASKRRTADELVITVWGMTQKGVLWKLDEWGSRGVKPSEFVDQWFTFRAKWGRPRLNGVESNGVQGVYLELLREEMFRRGDYFEVVPVGHKGRKEARIMSVLQPRYRSGYIRHARRFPEYETQLLDYPKVAHDDRVDASAACIVLLDPLAANAAGDVDLGKDTAPPLEEVYGGDWRQY